jgi:hypothetical protein
MTFKDEFEAIEAIKKHQTLTPLWKEMRDYSKELKSLVNGTEFLEELICKIEGIESDKKAKARVKYSKNIKSMFNRLFQPIDNIYYASGGLKDYDIKESIKKDFLYKIANIRDNKTLSEWVQQNAVQLFNTDPNGLIFIEYKDGDAYPTYKSIDAIRYYKSKGQIIDFVIFEPYVKETKTYWRIVDDAKDMLFQQLGNEFVLQEEKTFDNPFGQVPALICSNYNIIGQKNKLAAIDGILDDAKEYARDQSFLTLYKVYKGNPIFWKYVQYCGDCNGSGVVDDKTCNTCNGHGKYVGKNDVTDAVELPIPDDNESPIIAPNIAGFISPDLDVWTKYEETLKLTEEQIYKSHWGTMYGMQQDNAKGEKTATEIIADKQPLENQLNKYADFCEYIEWKLSEWLLNFYDPEKNKNESAITINLGRRYIIESYDILLERYEKSVVAQENNTVLDKLFSEYLGAKYRNNPIDLQSNLVKAQVEPYLHLQLKDVITIFGNEEAQRKVLFQKFWQTVKVFNDADKIQRDFDIWFESNKPKTEKTVV